MIKIYDLVGYCEDKTIVGYHNSTSSYYERVVATFDSEKAAHDYAKEGKLKRKNEGVVFKKRSLLYGYEGYEVREREELAVPHNPEVR